MNAKKNTNLTLAPTSSKWFSALSSDDQAIYLKIPAKMDYVDNDDFHADNAEAKYFGSLAKVVEVPSWNMFAEDLEAVSVPAGRRHKLSAAEEATLFLRYNYARYRLAELHAKQEARKLTSRARKMVRWQRLAQKLRAELTQANLALVVAMAKRTRIPNCDFAELISEGNIALLRSIEKFDVARGFKFSTYACRAILKAYNRLATKTGRYRQLFPTEFDPELEKSDWDVKRHEMMLEVEIADLQDVLNRNRANLSETEQLIVKERFAIGREGKKRTLAQLSEIVGLTNERIRQIQNRALGKLRVAMTDEPKVA